MSRVFGVFAALQNAKEIFEGRWAERAYEVSKKGKRSGPTALPSRRAGWPTRFARPPSIHIHYDSDITVDGQPVPALIPVTLIWALNNFDALSGWGQA